MIDPIVEQLGKMSVLDGDGQSTRLGTLWEERPVVLVLVRHFGCMFCKEQVSELGKHLDEIREAGGELVVVGNGGPEHVRWFREDYGVEMPVYTDPTLEVYDTVGAKRGLFTSLNPQTVKASFSSLRRGHKQSRTMGHGFQQGGVFIVAPDGTMPYRYVSDYAGDHPEPARVVEALKAATRRSAA